MIFGTFDFNPPYLCGRQEREFAVLFFPQASRENLSAGHIMPENNRRMESLEKVKVL